MAFAKDDYWQNRTPASGAQIRPVPTGPNIPGILARSKSLNPPTTQEVFDAIAALTAEADRKRAMGQTLDTSGQDQLDQLLYGVSKNVGRASLYNDPADAYAPKTVSQAVAPRRQATASDAGLLKNVGQNILDAVSGIFGGGQQDESPEALFRRLQEAAGQYTYSGPSAEEMASAEFDPQFALLKQIADQTSKRYQTQKSEVANLYRGLEDRTIKGRAEDQAAYNAAVQGAQGNYAASSKNLSQGVTANSTAMAQELARLGILEGTADVTAGVQQNLQNNLGQLNSQGLNQTNLLKTLGANEYAYDTDAIALNRQQGVETQADFMKMFQDAMAQNDMQRLGLTGQQRQAQNSYEMQIQKLLQEGQQGLSNSITDQFSAIQGANDNQADNFYRQAQLDLDQQRFSYQQQQDALKMGQSGGVQNAYDALQQRALTTYKDPIKARQAVDEILAAYQNNPNAQNVADFLNSVDQETLRQNPELTSLIYDFMSRVIGQQKR